ncbi:MAG: biopolymer transporter ExbD [Chlorobi bacterium]|nr:biopolymer transporter ExbD [Chlorobiota bacterium]
MARRKLQEINAGSMADIAFLLLIFFLVTTTMETLYGVARKLPPPPDPNQEKPIVKERNVLDILINRNDELMIEERPASYSEIKDEVVKHITNFGKDPNYSVSPEKAVINITHDRGTSYKAYLTVYNEILRAYNQVRNEEAMAKYGKPFDKLTKAQQEEIKKKYPQIVAEQTPKTL